MGILFTPSEINGMTLPNRFVRSATWDRMAADDGACTSQQTDLMSNLAKGGVGLIITGHAYVRKDGQVGQGQLGIYKDELVPGLQDLVTAVHEKGGKIVMQLSHAGFYANSALIGQQPLAPSEVEEISKSPRKEMSIQDIQEVVESFGEAARRAKRAGFDGVQMHSAHGFLLNQFLSPVFNHRTDDYGGGIQNRARALLEVLQAIRNTVGRDYPVLVKLNSRDFIENGLSLEDSLSVGSMLAERGIDAIELSGGLPTNPKLGPVRMGINSEDREAYFRNEAKYFKETINVPLILVGGIRSYHVAEELVDDGMADYISMSRPFIREPDLINRWREGDLQNASCISDNRCLAAAMAGKGIYCVTEKEGK